MQNFGEHNVGLVSQQWALTEASPVTKLRRLIGPQCFTLAITAPVSEISTFWLTGGVNLSGPNYEVPYQKSSAVPTEVGCTLITVDPVPGSVFKNVFQFTNFTGVVLNFRFSPSQAFPPTVEVDVTSVPFIGVLSMLAILPAGAQNLVSTFGNFSRKVIRDNIIFPAATVNASIPLPLRRVIGIQIWNVEIADANTSIEGGKFIVNYGDRRNPGGYIGTISPLANARILYQKGITIIPFTPTTTPSSLEFERTFRLSMPVSGRNFDIWFDPKSFAPTIRLTGAPMLGGTDLLVRIQQVGFNDI